MSFKSGHTIGNTDDFCRFVAVNAQQETYTGTSSATATVSTGRMQTGTFTLTIDR